MIVANDIYKIVVLPEAVSDLKKARKWYKNYSENAAKEFIKAYENASNSLKNQPHRTPKRNNHHILIIQNYPYIIFYIIESKIKTVLITAVFNTFQDPIKYPNF